jgi:hypothetical protein
MRKLPLIGLVLGVPFLMASSAVAAIHPLEGLNPADYGFATNNPSQWFRGWEFTVNVDDVVVTELGLRMPNAGDQVYLELWDSSTQSLLATTDLVTSAANDWRYFELDSGVPLDNGGQYVVGILAPYGGTYWYQGNLIGTPWCPTGDISYVTMRYHNNGTSGWPGSNLYGYQYGVPDIGYVIPAPASIALLALGVGCARRRRR